MALPHRCPKRLWSLVLIHDYDAPEPAWIADRFPPPSVTMRFADCSSGLLPDLCSRGFRASLTLTDGAGGFLSGVPAERLSKRGCLGMASQRRLRRRRLLRDNLDENGGGSRSVKRRPVAKR
jgi:hypothetical protein